MSGSVDMEAYLTKKDPQLGRLIKIVRAHKGEPMRPPSSNETPFEALVRAIIYQRVSESAGSTVYSRLEGIVGGKLTPKKISALTTKKIQTAGIAMSKSTYIGNIAAWFEANPKVAKSIPAMRTKKSLRRSPR
jgi:3-methyladenine DNA glycosylase/8-oxoguanine DNA glycosylase